MKICPFCAEQIQDDAIKCRYCNEFLDGSQRPPQNKKEKVPWYFSTTTIILGFICFAPISLPFVLPLVWFHPKWSRNRKIITTVIMVIVSWIIWKITAYALQNVMQYYKTVLH